MGSNSPLFSIVIPTCNRAHLLPHALQSILNHQRCDDYEVVVSDNFSGDDTAKVVSQFAGEKVRYVRTDRRLSMSDHWEFALQHTRGEYITYLCDDDVWTPDVLETVSATIDRYGSELIGIFRGRYYSQNCYWPEWRNSLSVTPFTARTLELDGDTTLQKLFSHQERMRMPKMFNSFCHKQLIGRAKHRWGRVFMSWCPDYSFPAIILTEVSRWTFIDVPLWLRYFGAESIGAGATYDRGGSFKQFVTDSGFSPTDDLFNFVPLQIPVDLNFSVETLLAVRRFSPEEYPGVSVNWETYFIKCWCRLLLQEREGTNVANDKQHFLEVLATRDDHLRHKVLSEIKRLEYDQKRHAYVTGSLFYNVRKRLRKFSTASALWTKSRRLWYRSKGMNPGIRIRGEEAGFHNILECALKVKGLVYDQTNGL